MDPHTRTFALLDVASLRLSQGRTAQMRTLLDEALANEERVKEPDLQAAGFREIGKVLASVDKTEAIKLLRRSIDQATKDGEGGSSTIADVAEEYAQLGELRLARTIAESKCQPHDRLRVYAAILLKSLGEQRRRMA